MFVKKDRKINKWMRFIAAVMLKKSTLTINCYEKQPALRQPSLSLCSHFHSPCRILKNVNWKINLFLSQHERLRRYERCSAISSKLLSLTSLSSIYYLPLPLPHFLLLIEDDDNRIKYQMENEYKNDNGAQDSFRFPTKKQKMKKFHEPKICKDKMTHFFLKKIVWKKKIKKNTKINDH